MENIEENNSGYEYVMKLNSLCFLVEPSIYICWSKFFSIQNYKQSLTSGIYFRSNNPCMLKRNNILTSSFFENLSNIKL